MGSGLDNLIATGTVNQSMYKGSTDHRKCELKPLNLCSVDPLGFP